MMKTVVEVNSNNYASTGNIVLNIAKEARKEGFKVYTSCRKSRAGLKYRYEDQIYIGTWLDRVISERLSYLFGLNGYFNVINTWLFIRKLKQINPDIIHIHSMCDNYLNIDMFFRYIRDNKIPVIWTLHDNWAFTGRCAQFRCEKWQEGCGNCPHLDYFPASLFLDNTAKVWEKREKLYNSIRTMTIVTPSKWLSDLVRVSLFKENHPIKVINNGINLNIFKPVDSTFRKDHNIENKHMLLAVAYFWDAGKGLHVFQELAKRLPENYQIVMVGTNDEVDKQLPENNRQTGASKWTTFLKVVVPLSKPIMAVMVVFSMVAYWNDWFTALIYLTGQGKAPLPLVLRNILIKSSASASQASTISGGYAELNKLTEMIKFGSIIVAAAPMLIIYPFVQKYFEKGMMAGAVKG